ncbi:hypothetical protein HYS00_04225 [Candidatus Microgenomates bacterium]|nr:hypothetical protein [Candidatus Microgenomates bacterium]
MGKIRTRVVGDETAEKEQKDEQKKKAQEKKMLKKDKKTEKVEAEAEETVAVETESPKARKEAPKKEVIEQKKKKYGKKHGAALKKAESRPYTFAEAVSLLKKIKYAGFDETVELHLNVKEPGLKGEVSLPHTTGRSVRVSIVDEAVLGKLEKGLIDFDILITHPSYMPRLAKYARVLGPKGLMPNPKAGTISTSPEEVAKRYSGGLLKWKSEQKFPLVHQMIAKISQDDTQIIENAQKFIEAVGPQNISQVVIKTTMSPGLMIAL